MSEEPAVLFHLEGEHIGVITLNRPDNRNSMTSDLLDAFKAVVTDARRQRNLRCIIITGRGRCFSAGADLRAQVQREDPTGTLTPADKSYAMYVPFLSVLDLEVPTIAALNGHTVGGGFGLSLVCDIRVAAEGAKYGANFARLGFCSGMAVSYIFPRIIGASKAAELLFTGRLFSGTEGQEMGYASYALPTEDVFPKALALAEEIAASGPQAVRDMKKLLYQGLNFQPRAAAMAEAVLQAEAILSEDAKEGMAALLEKRTPQFKDR